MEKVQKLRRRGAGGGAAAADSASWGANDLRARARGQGFLGFGAFPETSRPGA